MQCIKHTDGPKSSSSVWGFIPAFVEFHQSNCRICPFFWDGACRKLSATLGDLSCGAPGCKRLPMPRLQLATFRLSDWRLRQQEVTDTTGLEDNYLPEAPSEETARAAWVTDPALAGEEGG